MARTRFTNPEHATVLTSASWSSCEALIKSFEEAWQRGRLPAITDFLRAEGRLRRALLIELVHVDLEFRLKAGEPARVETYLEAYPELATDPYAAVELLAAEYEHRVSRDSGIRLDEYRGRFPGFHDALLEHLQPADGDTAHHRIASRNVPQAIPAVPGYEILEEIGRGGMGVVYKAHEPSLGRNVALKFLPQEYSQDPDRLGRFLREARTASALNHPHICTVHALGEFEGRPFIVMEFIEGSTLQALISRRPGVEETVRVAGQAARALAAAHAAGVVHRDVKPENIMVREDGYVKVLDFGLARRLPTLAQGTLGPNDTDPGTFLGTAAYMSPEQARGQTADSASDIFSLGLVLYQLLTGQHPFEAETAAGMLYAIATRQQRPASELNPDIPPALDRQIEAMLRKDAQSRPTAAEVVANLGTVSHREPGMPVPALVRPIVHREPELAALRAALSSADRGRGSVVCVSGEPGIGKTTLVETFLGGLSGPGRSCLVARGHCSERLAGTEAYLPVLDALGSLLRGDRGDTVGRLLKTLAPSWFARVVPSADKADSRAFTQQAMLLEFSAFLEGASALGTAVLFFDDVHWADVSTVDLLAHLGSRCARLRVLVIVTYRPTELLLGPHPFHAVKLELQGKGVGRECELDFLGREDVARYLSLAFPGHAFPEDLADLVYSRTEGSPLFLVDLLRYLQDQGVIAETAGRWTLTRQMPDCRRELPPSIRAMIERKISRLGEEDHRLLVAASVQGHEFDSAVVAGALIRDPAEVEDRLQALERVHGLVRLVREYELSDRTLTLRYAFVHVLYQQALYADLTPGRRATLGAAVARTLERHHGEGNPAVAAELACLYEVARDFQRAARQFWLAAQNAARVFAHREAVVLARRGLGLLGVLPETAERAALEMPLQITLGLQLQVTDGYAAPGAKDAYCRARDLCSQAAGSRPQFPVLWGLWLYYKVRSELSRAQEMADELLALARQVNEPDLALQAHQALGITALCRGELAASLRNVEQAAALYDFQRHRTHSFQFGQDPGVICFAFGAVSLWLLGYPDQAARQSERAIQMSQDLSPNSQAVAFHFAAMVHQLLGDVAGTRKYAETSATIAAEHGFSFWMAGSAVLRGWAQGMSGARAAGLDLLRQGLRDWAATGSGTYRTWYLGLLAEVLGRHGQLEEARRVLDESLLLCERTGEYLYAAELHRLRGDMLLRSCGEGEPVILQSAREDFQRALDIARGQEARSLQLRAAMSLARAGGSQGDSQEARRVLAEVAGTFTEGFQTPDLREAREVLERLR